MAHNLQLEDQNITGIYVEVKEVRPTSEEGPLIAEEPLMIDTGTNYQFAPMRVSFGWPPGEVFFKNMKFLFKSYDKFDNTQVSGPKYLTDGLILTPVNTRYRPTSTLLPLAQRTANLVPEVIKWKPPDQLTVDLAVIGHQVYSWKPLNVFTYGKQTYTIKDLTIGANKLEDLEGILLVQAERDKLRVLEKVTHLSRPSPVGTARTQDRFYIRLALNPIPRPYVPDEEMPRFEPQILVLEGSYAPFYGTAFISFDAETQILWAEPLLRNLPDKTVVEFRWQPDPENEDDGKMIPVRIREEKPLPNDFEIVEEIWKMLHDPITKGVLTGDDWTLQRKYFTRLKRELYDLAFDNRRGLKILVSGGGRGGEAHMFRRKASAVTWIEPDPENWSRLGSRTAAESKFYKSTLIKKKTEDVALNEIEAGSFDIVTSMLSITFFDQDALRHFYKLVDHALKPGGKLIIFSIDGDAVQEVFRPAFGPSRPKLPLILGQVQLEDFGDYFITTYPKGIGQLATGQKEYYFSFFSLLKELFGYERDYLVRARGEPFLKSEQWKFASLFTACIMSKKERQSYAKRVERAASSMFLASGLDVSEQEQEEEVEKVHEENLLLIPFGKIELRRLPEGRFWQALLDAISPTYSEALAAKKNDQYENQLRKELVDRIYDLAGADEPPEWLSDFSNTEIVDFARALGHEEEYPENLPEDFRPIEPLKIVSEKGVKEEFWESQIWNKFFSKFAGKNERQLRVLDILGYVLGLNILIYRPSRSTPQLINQPLSGDYPVVVLLQTEDGFDVIGELDIETEPPMYRTLFRLNEPETPAERYFRRALGLSGSQSSTTTPIKSG
jgi:SAM-dependent methyltransferase